MEIRCTEQAGSSAFIGDSRFLRGVVISVRICLMSVSSSSSEDDSELLEDGGALLVEGLLVVATFGLQGRHGRLFGRPGTCWRASSHEARSIRKYSVVVE